MKVSETNKFKDGAGDSIQAVMGMDGIIIYTSGVPMLDDEQVDELIKQLTALNKELRDNM